MSLVLAGGSVVGPDGVTDADVKVEDGEIVEIGPGLSGDETIDCSGAWVGPGLVDIHVHLREPGEIPPVAEPDLPSPFARRIFPLSFRRKPE